MDFGNITTNIIKNGLVFNMDAANRASTIPSTSTDKTFNTVNLSQSGSFAADAVYDSSTISPSFAFDGTGDYINWGTDIDFSSFSLGVSINIWVNYSSTNSYSIFSKGASNNIGIWISGGNTLNFYMSTGGWSGHTISTLSASTWINVCCTYDNSNQKIYKNGILGDTNSKSGGVPGSGVDFYIGYLAGVPSYALNGNIGPYHIYNRALSANEVLHNYNALKSRFE